jgi:hypothetical protein
MAAVIAAAWSFASAALPQAPTALSPDAPGEGHEVEQVVVTARRIGLPVWRITRGEATLVLIADADVPRGGVWRPEALDAAVKGARSMFVPQLIRQRSAVDQGAILQREGLSRDSVPLEPDLEDRLNRAAHALRIRGARTRNLRVLARIVIAEVLGADRRKEDGASIATRAANKHRVRRVPFRGFEGIRAPETVEAAKAREVRCVQSAVELAEHAEEDSAQRLAAWRRVDVPGLAASRLEAAARDCSALAGARYALAQPTIEAALRSTLNERGVTIAVLPLWSLADPGKLLDELSRDLLVAGPRWRD